MTALLFIIACVGITNIICYGKILEPLRKWDPLDFFKCPMCVGFWVGFTLECVGFNLVVLHHVQPLDAIAWGAISSVASYAFCMTIGDEGLKIKNS